MRCSLEELADGLASVLGRRDGKGGCGDMNRIGVGKRYPVECFCMLAVLLVAVIQLLVSPAYADSGDLLSSQGEDFGLEEIVDEGSPVSPDSSAGSPSGDLGSGGEGEAPAGGQGEPPVGGDGEAAGSPSDPPDAPTADEEGGGPSGGSALAP